MINRENINLIKEDFKSLGCAQLYDAATKYCKVLPLSLKSRTAINCLAGPVFPVITDNDMLPCLQALDLAPEGSIIFIHNQSEVSEALAGDIFVTAAISQNIEGLVINGAVRDIDTIESMGLPVFSKEVTFVSAKTAQVASNNIPCKISIDDFEIEPNDWIFIDSDGALLVKETYLSVVYKSAKILRKREEELRMRLINGERLSELCGLKDYLEGNGLLRFEV